VGTGNLVQILRYYFCEPHVSVATEVNWLPKSDLHDDANRACADARRLGVPKLMSASTGLRDVKDWRITNNENALIRNGG